MNVPLNLLYTKDHEWLLVEEATATIGITDYAQHELGDIVFVDLPKTGTRAVAGKSCGSIESVKAVSEIFAPVTGEIVEANPLLDTAPETCNKSPYGEGWIARIRIANPSEIEALLRPEAYRKLIESLA